MSRKKINYYKLFCLSLSVFVFFTSCSSSVANDSNSEVAVSKKIDSTHIYNENDSLLNIYTAENKLDLKPVSNILFIPIDADCEDCLLKSVHFLKSNLNRKDLFFVVVCQFSKETILAKKKYGVPDGTYSNVLFDKKNFWGKNQVVVSFPELFRLSKGKVAGITELNASNIENTYQRLTQQK